MHFVCFVQPVEGIVLVANQCIPTSNGVGRNIFPFRPLDIDLDFHLYRFSVSIFMERVNNHLGVFGVANTLPPFREALRVLSLGKQEQG